MNEKKVIAFIVEGASDEAALGTIMKENFSDNEIQFVVVHGDITSKVSVSPENILKEIDKLIDGIKNKYRYRSSDFIKIIHIVDMDGVYISDADVREADLEEVQYNEEFIAAKNADAIIKRNKRKADILYKLRKTGALRGIPYQIYYNACNLEHVLYGTLKSFTDEEKQILSDDFAEKYEGKAEEFIEFISNPEIAVSGSYQETWKYIEKDKNSLNRHSNMHLIFA